MKIQFLPSHKIVLAILFSILVQESALAAQDGSDEWRVSPRKARVANPIAAEESSIVLGKKLYLQECQQCHGETGKGDGPVAAALTKSAANLSSAEVLQQSDGAIYTKIRTGRSPMPSFKSHLTQEDVWHLVNFIRHDIGAPLKLSDLK